MGRLELSPGHAARKKLLPALFADTVFMPVDRIVKVDHVGIVQVGMALEMDGREIGPALGADTQLRLRKRTGRREIAGIVGVVIRTVAKRDARLGHEKLPLGHVSAPHA